MKRTRRTTPVRMATIEEIDTAILDMPAEFLECRDEQHLWQKLPPEYDDKRRCHVRVRKCGRCTKRKTIPIGSDGYPAGPTRYEDPEGYLFTGIGRVGTDARARIRLVCMTKEIEEFERIQQERAALKPRRRKG